ncbi:hypothetical protein J6590_088782 [Homalodisca vitripennis]|nr:hypothetical protein J6590_088782 [Homalodisca vitripennis]
MTFQLEDGCFQGVQNPTSKVHRQWVGYPTFSASSIVHTNVIVTAGETNAKSNILQHWVGLPNFLSVLYCAHKCDSDSRRNQRKIQHSPTLVTAGETNAKSNILQHWVGLPNFLSVLYCAHKCDSDSRRNQRKIQHSPTLGGITQLSQRPLLHTNVIVTAGETTQINILQHWVGLPNFLSVLYCAHKCDSDRRTNANNILQHGGITQLSQRPLLHTNVIVTAGETNANQHSPTLGGIPNFLSVLYCAHKCDSDSRRNQRKIQHSPTLGGITQLSQRPLLCTQM